MVFVFSFAIFTGNGSHEPNLTLSNYSQQNEGLKYGPVGRQPPFVSHGVAENKMTRIGAVMDGMTGQVIYLQADKFGKLAMAQLYRLIRQHYPERKVFVVQDNCSFHYSDNVLATAAELDIIPVYLPTYASWLNPIEKLWRWLKADVLRGHEFAHDPQLLRQVVAQFLDQFADGSSALLRYVGLLPT
ncbi:MAG: transposase [Anaerolineaceae bacterium]|nr:transposase [Anaerolineaceae bacterium]